MRSLLLKGLAGVPIIAAFAAISALVPSGRAPAPVGNPVLVALRAIIFTRKGINPLGLIAVFFSLMTTIALVRFLLLWLEVRRGMR